MAAGKEPEPVSPDSRGGQFGGRWIEFSYECCVVSPEERENGGEALEIPGEGQGMKATAGQ